MVYHLQYQLSRNVIAFVKVWQKKMMTYCFYFDVISRAIEKYILPHMLGVYLFCS